MTIKEFTKELTSNQRIEGELIKTVFLSLFSSFFAVALLYFFKLRNVGDFIPSYGYYILFIILSYAIIMPSIKQVGAYKNLACMSGMMVGMTLGMVSGFLIGFFVGAVSGMFWGSVFGMAIGIFMGVWSGKCCGIMGILEGLMAGFMGGLMGAMTAVMLYNEPLKIAGVILFIICSIILVGLNYMVYVETKREERQIFNEDWITMLLSAVLSLITTWMIVFGPKSALFV